MEPATPEDARELHEYLMSWLWKELGYGPDNT